MDDHVTSPIKSLWVEVLFVLIGRFVIPPNSIWTPNEKISGLAIANRHPVIIYYQNFIVGRNAQSLFGYNNFVFIVKSGVIHKPFGHSKNLLKPTPKNRLYTSRRFLTQFCSSNLQNSK